VLCCSPLHPNIAYLCPSVCQPPPIRQETKMKNSVFWDVTPRGFCKNRRFGGTYRLHHQGAKNRRAKKNVSSN
jgi:hypothetical protein